MFIPYKYHDRVRSWEYYPMSAMTPQVGLALKLDSSSGQLVSAAADFAEFICMQQASANVVAGTMVPVIKADKDDIFESKLDATNNALTVGTVADIDSTGLLVDADAATDHAFEILYLAGTTQGSVVRGRFK